MRRSLSVLAYQARVLDEGMTETTFSYQMLPNYMLARPQECTHTGEMIDLRHLIDLNVDHLITFTDHVHSSILNNKTYNQYIHNDQFFAATEPKWKLYKRFAIKDDQLIIYFDMFK